MFLCNIVTICHKKRMFMTNDKQVAFSPLWHTKSACLPIIESKSILDHSQKFLQALDDGLKWGLSRAGR